MGALSDFRTANPAYDDMPDEALADALHRKFYADMPKEEVYKTLGLEAPTTAAETAAASQPARETATIRPTRRDIPAPTSVMDGFVAKEQPAAPKTFSESIERPGPAPDKFDTKLTPQEETKFRDWKAKNAPNDSGADYDLRGAFKAGLAPGADGHWSDEFKKPNHPTFSNQSRYASQGDPGTWAGTYDEKTKKYTPPKGDDKFTPSTKPLERAQSSDHLLLPTDEEIGARALRTPGTEEEQPTAPAIASFKAAPKIFERSMGQAMADIPQAVTNEAGRIVALQKLRQHVANLQASGQPYTPPDLNRIDAGPETERATYAGHALGSYASELAAIDKQIADVSASRGVHADVSEQFQRDIKDVTPPNQGFGGKVITSVAGSLPSTMAGVAAGVATGNPLIGAVVMGGPQYAQSYAQTMATGDRAREVVLEFKQFDNNVARERYLDSILRDKYADTPFQTDAARVKKTLGEIDDKLEAGLVSASAARQMKDRAFASFSRNMDTIATNAQAGSAFWGGLIDGIAEVAGENLGLGEALKVGTPIFTRMFNTLLKEAGQEGATQIVQTLNQVLRYDPTMTLKQGLEQVAIAMASGAAMGGGMAVPGAMIEAGRQPAPSRAQQPFAASSSVPPADGGGGSPPLSPKSRLAALDAKADGTPDQTITGPDGKPVVIPGQPSQFLTDAERIERNRLRATVKPDPGTRGDLEAVMADPRSLNEIRQEQAKQAVEAAAPHVQEVAQKAVEQSAVKTAAGEAAARAAGIPARGERATVTWPDGESQTVTVREPYAEGAQVELEDGQVMDLTTKDVKFGPAPLGEGTREAPVVAEAPGDVAKAGERVDQTATDAQKDAGNYRKGHVEFQGLDVTIENPKGSVRRSTNPESPWEVDMPAHYGYIKRTVGADEEHIDAYIGDNVGSKHVFIVDQIDPATGNFDEHKIMLGFTTKAHAVATYHTAFNDASGPSRIGAITQLTLPQFKAWLKMDEGARPIAYNKPEKAKPVAEIPATEQIQPVKEATNAVHPVQEGQQQAPGGHVSGQSSEAPERPVDEVRNTEPAGQAEQPVQETGAGPGSDRAGRNEPVRGDAVPAESVVDRFKTPRRIAWMGKKGKFNIDFPNEQSATSFDIGAKWSGMVRKDESEINRAQRIANARDMAARLARQIGSTEADVLRMASAYRENVLEAVKGLGGYTGADQEARVLTAEQFGMPKKPVTPQIPPLTHSVLPSFVTQPHAKPKETKAPEPETIAAKPETPPVYGATNKVFTLAAAEKARALLKAKLGQLNAGLDPEVVQAGIQLAGFYIESGARSFVDYSAKMIADLGESVRPYLKSWYAAIYFGPEIEKGGMDDPSSIKADAVLPKENSSNSAENVTETAQKEPQTGQSSDAPEQGSSPTTTGGMTVTATKDTKTGEPIWVAKIGQRVGRDEYNRLNARAKSLGGYYSKFVKGFIFKDPAKANEFAGQTPPSTPEEPTKPIKPTVAPITSSPAMRLAERIKSEVIEAKHAINNVRLMQMARDEFGDTFNPKEVYDAVEAGMNLWLRENGEDLNPSDVNSVGEAKNIVAGLREATNYLPTQNVRDKEQDEYQQFSTPPAIAWLQNWVAHVREGETALEPSGGMGGLAVFAEMAGAHVVINELSARRSAVLKDLFPDARIFKEDATQINNVLPDDIKPTVVVMNPPFSATAGRIEGRRSNKEGLKHIDQALKRLEPGGRLSLLMGEGMALDLPGQREWWDSIRAEYNLRANIGIDGSAYMKYGTTFGVQLIVIDKTGPTTGTPIVAKDLQPEDVPALLEGIRNDRPESGAASEQHPTQPGSGQVSAQTPAQQGPAERPGAGNVGTGERVGDKAAEPNPADTGRSGTETANAGENAAAGSPAVRGGGRRGKGAAPGGPVESAGQEGSSEPAPSDSIQQHGGESGLAVESQASEKAQGELSDSVYENYTPKRLKIPGAQPHPGKLVESAAMSAVDPPMPTYTPNLPKEVIEKGMLSIAQLEAVVYAGQAHSQLLPGTEGEQERRGFFIGDGTGVGKGREIGGIILDNLRQGRTKAVWVSEKQGLHKDAQRDFAGVGGNPDTIFKHSATNAKKNIVAKAGILFTTYSMLRSGEKKQATSATDPHKQMGKSRVEQLVDWLGPKFDGVIVFDEAHNMANAIQQRGARGVKKPSAMAIAGLKLQEKLPLARIVYVSATGATEVQNLAYAARLGLWGEGTPFASRAAFISQIHAGGVAVMELVAQNMKALGAYISRSLSYDGVTYDRLEHTLEPIQHELYNKLADTWQGVLRNIDAALTTTGQAKNGNAKGAALSRFWGAHQRFFNQIITAMQMPTILEDARKALEAGDAVVMQLVNTNEAEQERQAARAEVEGEELEELEFGPMDSLIEFVKNGFPVQQYVEQDDGNGNVISVPAMTEAGNPIINKDAERARDALLAELESMKRTSAIPGNPIDLVLEEFGPDNVAEITGRSRRFVRIKGTDGEVTMTEQKRGAAAAVNDAKDFMDDKKKVLIFSDAGGTGFSFQSDLNSKNQRMRHHYLVQPGWRADKAVQGFGRTHRTNEANQPKYLLPTTNLKAQKRFISSVARRLDQLGALTKGQRQTGSQGLFSAKDNLESQYSTAAVTTFFQDLHAGRTPLDFTSVAAEMGLDIVDPRNGSLNQDKIPTVPRFLNRLLSLRVETQDQVFEEFIRRMEEAVEGAIAQGRYNDGMETVRAQKVEIEREETAHVDERSGAETKYYDLRLTHPHIMNAFNKVQKAIEDEVNAHPDTVEARDHFFYRNEKSGKVYAIIDRGQRVGSDGYPVTRGSRWGVTGNPRYVDNVEQVKSGKTGYGANEVKYTRLTEAEARVAWSKELEKTPTTFTEHLHMIAGAILPVWDRITGDNARVVRTQTTDGTRIIGRVVPAAQLKDTLRNLGVGSTTSNLKPEEIFDRVAKGEHALMADGAKLTAVKLLGNKRIELVFPRGMTNARSRQLLNQGAQVERHQWVERAFIPNHEVLGRILKGTPIVEIGKPGANETDADEKYSLGDTGAPQRIDPRVEAEVRRIAKLLAPGANLELVDRYFAEGEALVRSGADGTSRREVAGSYQSLHTLITVALGFKRPMVTIRHEAIHALKDMGMFTPAEWTVLEREAEKTWMARYGLTDTEESIAYAFQYYRDGKGPTGGLVGKAFARIKDFFERLGNALRGLGFQNVEDVFGRIESGEVGKSVRKGSEADMASMDLASYRAMPESFRKAVRDDLDAVLGKFTGVPLEAENPETAAKFSLGKDLPANIAVLNKQSSDDINPIKRFFWNPRNAFKDHPTLSALQQYATDIETNIARTARNLADEYNEIRGRFKRDGKNWETLTDALWVGDAHGHEFTDAELRDDLGWTEAKLVKAYGDFRNLVTKIGRLVDMHRRSMLPQYRARKEAVLNQMRTMTVMDDAEFRSLYGKRARLRAKVRAGTVPNIEAALKTLKDLEAEMQGIRAETDEYQDLLGEVDRLDGILAETSIRKREGYVPHKFFGTYAVYRLVEEPVLDKDGHPTMNIDSGEPIMETVHKLVAGEHGFYPTQRDAINAAKRVATLDPKTPLVVKPVQFKFPNSAATTLTDASYWALMGNASKAMGLSGQDLKDAMEGVARRRFRRRIAGFAQFRSGVEGFSTDMDKVMRSHVNEAVRYVFLDKLKYRAINDMEKMGMSPFRSSNQKNPTLTRMVEAYLRDMNGQKQPGEVSVDEWLDKLLGTVWGKPVLVGIPAAVAGSTLLFGIATNPLVAAAVSGYVGYRMYSSLSKGGEFKSRTLTQDLMGDMAHAKLGAIFNLGSAVVNLTQTAINCVDEETEALTRSGWKKHSALKVGEDILCYDIGSDTCRWGPLRAVARMPYKGKLFTLESGQISARTTDGHRWPVTDKTNGKRYTVTNGLQLPSGNGRGSKRHERLATLHTIPLGRPVDNLPDRSSFSDAFVALMGWIAAEGHLVRELRHDRVKSRGTIRTIEISQSGTKNAAKLETIRKLLYVEGAKWSERTDSRSGVVILRMSAVNAKRFLPYMAGNKVPTNEFLCSLPQRQLQIIIDAMIDGDGTRPKGTQQALFSNTDKALIDAFQMAVTLAGGSCRVIGPVENGKFSTKPIYHVRVSHGRYATSATVVRAAQAPTDYEGTVWCPNVGTGFWVARRAGRTYCTGNTLPVLGPKYTMVGMMKLEEALRSRITGKPNEDYRLLERSDTVSNDTYTETQLLQVAQHSLARWSLFFFRTTENFNRAVSFLGAYHRSKDRGDLPGPSFKEAEAAMGFTQHHYGQSNKAEVLRNVFLRVPAQFKNYMMQQIAFTFELGRKAKTGASIYDEHLEIPRHALAVHLASLFLVSGAVGLPFTALLAAIIKGVADWDPLDELKRLALEAQSRGKLSAAAWLTLVRGLPAYALGEDMSARAGMGEQFTPQQASDLAGPWFGTMSKAIQLGELQAGFVDQLANVSPGAGKPLKAIEAMANGMPLWTAATDNKAFYEALADNQINWVSPWKNRTEFDESILSKADVARMAVGSTPTKVGMIRDEVKATASDIALDKKATQLYVNKIVSAVRTYGHSDTKLDAAMAKITTEMEKAGIDLREQTIIKALADDQKPRLQRSIEGAPSKMREKVGERAMPLLQSTSP